MKNTKKQIYIAIGLAALAIIFAIISWFLLPQDVISQMNYRTGAVHTVDKPLAVFIPLAITLVGDILFLTSGGSAKERNLGISILGLALVVAIYVFNFIV